MVSSGKSVEIQPVRTSFIGFPVRYHHLTTAGKAFPHHTLAHITLTPGPELSMIIAFRRARAGCFITILYRAGHLGRRDWPWEDHGSRDRPHPRPGFQQTEGKTGFNPDLIRPQITPKCRRYWQGHIH